MSRVNRRTATRVRDGRVQKKNNWRPAPGDYRAVAQDEIRLERRRPADGHRHLITVAQLREFVGLLPDWEEAAIGLRAIVLDSDTDCFGWYQSGVVAVCNWEQDLWSVEDPDFLNEHAELLGLLGVELVPLAESYWVRDINETLDELELGQIDVSSESRWREVRWTEAQARAFLLVNVLPHELGHHHDCVTTRSRRVSRGEPYAETYARRALETLWPAYTRRFGI